MPPASGISWLASESSQYEGASGTNTRTPLDAHPKDVSHPYTFGAVHGARQVSARPRRTDRDGLPRLGCWCGPHLGAVGS